VSFISFVALGTDKVLSLVVSNNIESINSNWGVSFHSILLSITQLEIRFKTKVSHKHMVVIYHRNTPLPKVRKGLDRYKRDGYASVAHGNHGETLGTRRFYSGLGLRKVKPNVQFLIVLIWSWRRWWWSMVCPLEDALARLILGDPQGRGLES
jgi:hypothetical protein